MGVHEDLERVRRALIHELDVINLYHRDYEQAEDPRVKALLSHLRDEEKEHVAECVELIKQMDPTQAEEWTETHPLLIAAGQAEKILQIQEGAELEESPSAPATPRWTVGSLIGEPQ